MKREDLKAKLRVKTARELPSLDDPCVKKVHCDARRPGVEGVISSHVPDTDGEYWLVRHNDRVAVYTPEELEPINAPS